MTTTEVQATPEDLDSSPEFTLALTAELLDPQSEWHQRFYDERLGVAPTPVWQLPEANNGHTILIKDETAHKVELNGEEIVVKAFKRRGAWAAMVAPLKPGEMEPDVYVAASAGNHAHGVAVGAALLGKKSEVHCRPTISDAKRASNESVGATIIDSYESLEDALFGAELAEGMGDDGLVRKNILPFDQPEVIAGQATMVDEWLSSLESAQAAGELDLHNDAFTVVVPVGGGGLISGWAMGLEVARRQGRIGNNVRLVGAQMERCDAMNRAIKLGDAWDGGYSLRSDQLNDKSDGTAVRRPGNLTFTIVQEHVDEIIVLTPAEVGRAMDELSQLLNKDVEPAGALGYAASQALAGRGRPDTDARLFITSVASGANVSEETKTYFSDQVALSDARAAFKALSDAQLARNVAYEELMAQEFDLRRATGHSSIASGPTHPYRTGLVKPEPRK